MGRQLKNTFKNRGLPGGEGAVVHSNAPFCLGQVHFVRKGRFFFGGGTAGFFLFGLLDELGGTLTLDYAVYVGGDKTSDALLQITWKA